MVRSKKKNTTERQRAKNTELRKALQDCRQELDAAQKNTRDLAGWALTDRSILIAESQHKQNLLQNYEAALKQREQELHALQKAEQDCTVFRPREGNAVDQHEMARRLRELNKRRERVGLLPIESVCPGVQQHAQSSETAQDWILFPRQGGAAQEFGEGSEEMSSPRDGMFEPLSCGGYV